MTDETLSAVDTSQPAPADNAAPAKPEAQIFDLDAELSALDDEDRSAAEAIEGAGGQDNGDDPADELDEIKINGRKYKVHKDLKDGVMMHADYTRKTQELAEQRRELEGQLTERASQQAQLSQDELRGRAILADLDVKLEQYGKVNWDRWETEDPMEAQRAWRAYQQMKDTHGRVTQALGARETERSEAAQRDTAKRYQETAEFAQKEIPGWSPALDTQLQEFAAKEGIPDTFVRENMSPLFYRFLHRAFVGDQTMQRIAAAKTKTPASALQPLEKVASQSNPGPKKALKEMGTEDFIKARQAGRLG